MSYAPQQSTDHVARGLKKLLWQFRDKPRMKAFLATLLAEVQKIEDASFEVALYRNIENGFGVILDMIGKLLNVGRNGLADDAFKIALRARIRVLLSSGSLGDLLAVAILSSPGSTFEIQEYPPAAFSVTTDATVGIEQLWEAIRTVKAAGVRIDFYFVAGGSGMRWGWSGDSAVGGKAGWSGDSAVGDPLYAHFYA